MKVTLLILLFTMLLGTAYADLYVPIENNEPLGVVSVRDESLPLWEARYLMKKVGEEYRGKQKYEIKYDGGLIREATQTEIDAHLWTVEQERESIEILKWLDKLEDPTIKEKIKKIKNGTP